MTNRKKIILVSVACTFLLLTVFAVLINALGACSTEYTDITDQVKAQIIDASGNTRDVEVKMTAGLDAGDQAVFTVQLPERETYQSSELCFYQYHFNNYSIDQGLQAHKAAQSIHLDHVGRSHDSGSAGSVQAAVSVSACPVPAECPAGESVPD